ncbi:MAG: DUF1512 domain-containing protein [Candidatus Bathyarchaeia archaeon]
MSQAGDNLGIVVQMVYLFSFLIFMFYGQRFQTWMMLREIEGALIRLKALRDEARKITVDKVKEFGDPDTDPASRIDQLIEYFTIMPSNLDPAGIVPKIEHLIETYDRRFKDEVKLLAPTAVESQQENITGLLTHTLGLNTIYRSVNHFYLMGKKTMSLYLIMQIQMQLPLVMQIAEAYSASVKAFAEGQPIGDGVGALVAAKLMYGYPKEMVARETVMAKVPFEGRHLLVVKAKGPGTTVGKPGEAIRNLIEQAEGKVAMVIMVDAMGKFEGEKSGETSEGAGAAIGGIGVEQFEIEAAATKYKIPVHGVTIKESVEESLSPMTKAISDGANVALARVKRIILEGTKENDVVIVAGIGNTVGIAQ